MKTYLRILAYGRQYYGAVGVALGCLVLYNVLNAVSLTLVIPFLEILFADPNPEAANRVIDWSAGSWKDNGYAYLEKTMATSGKEAVLVGFCIVVGIAILFKNVFRYASTYLLALLEQGIIRNLRNRLFEHLTLLSMGFFVRKKKGHLVNTVVNDVQIVQEGVVGTLMSVLSDPLMLLVFLGMMFLISWQLTLFSLIVLPITGVFIRWVSKTLKRKAHKGQRKLDDLLAVFDEFLGGVRVVKAFSAERYQRQRYEAINEDYFRIMVGYRRRNSLASPLTEVLSITVVLSIIYYGATLILNEQSDLKASEFIGYIALFSQFLAPTKTLSNSIARIQKAIASFNRIENLLAEPRGSTETQGTLPAPPFQQAIRIENLSFAHQLEGPPEESAQSMERTQVFEGLNLTIERGQTVALVGPSGAGKSTLADLLVRLYDPQHGQITLDGVDYREIDVKSLRAQMGIVTQEPILINDSVRANLLYGRTGFSDSELQQAAKIAHAWAFIQDLPLGLDTPLGERGSRLSGGQRQRIAIARAVLHNPPILVLDEATSALDTESERLVQDALTRLMKGRTSVIIAHRLSTVQHADVILVLNQHGQIAEMGTHAQLLAQKGLYAQLVGKQFLAT